jgi:hypothetical protein
METFDSVDIASLFPDASYTAQLIEQLTDFARFMGRYKEAAATEPGPPTSPYKT